MYASPVVLCSCTLLAMNFSQIERWFCRPVIGVFLTLSRIFCSDLSCTMNSSRIRRLGYWSGCVLYLNDASTEIANFFGMMDEMRYFFKIKCGQYVVTVFFKEFHCSCSVWVQQHRTELQRLYLDDARIVYIFLFTITSKVCPERRCNPGGCRWYRESLKFPVLVLLFPSFAHKQRTNLLVFPQVTNQTRLLLPSWRQICIFNVRLSDFDCTANVLHSKTRMQCPSSPWIQVLKYPSCAVQNPVTRWRA